MVVRIALLTAVIAMAGCKAPASDENPSALPDGLVGAWVLPQQEETTIFGFVSADVEFRADGSFTFQGTNPLSQRPLEPFTVDGIFERTADRVAFAVGDDVQLWTVEFARDGSASFRHPGVNAFRLVRATSD